MAETVRPVGSARLGRGAGRPRLAPGAGPAMLAARGLTVRSGARTILRNVDLEAAPGQVYVLVGPSGVGKSTLLRCLNRLIDLEPGLSVRGDVLFRGESIFGREVDSDALRTQIGMLFQQPVVFPRSVAENVVFGLKRLRRTGREELRRTTEEVLRRVALWEEVADRLDHPARMLSVGQQQRLCLARALATRPRVLLMDEPTSALDAVATGAIEELVLELKRDHTVVLVTHDLGQAERLADRVGCLCLRDGAGELLESRRSSDFFREPRCRTATESMPRGSFE